jgi:cyclopropane-fatty-acyl-phospholipid synthase
VEVVSVESGNKPGLYGNAHDSSVNVEKAAIKPARRSKSPLFHSRVTSFDRWLARTMLDVVGNPQCTLRLWDGADVSPPVDDPVAVILYGNRLAMWKTILNPELHWGDIYCNGQLEFDGDMARFLEIIYSNLRDKGKGGLVRRIIKWLGHRRIANSHAKAEENIHHHYDIGNDFYKLWLDAEEMQYTCAYFPDPDMSLEEAQVAKLHHLCRKLQLKPGDTVVEAGCGWGGLARFMARNYGVNVKAYNISKEQVRYARQRAEAEGLSGRIEYVLDDYRNISGEYDVFVSIGMLEHVGKRDYPILGDVIDRCLKPGGRGLIHTIGRINPGPMNAWIERRIFPGAYPPSLKEMMDIFEPHRLSVLDVENLRLHYAKTLEHWLERFEHYRDTIEEMMDEEFVRAWRLYLAGSIAAFNVGELQLYQVVFTRNTNNELPWSRKHLYSSKSDSKVNLSVVQGDVVDA